MFCQRAERIAPVVASAAAASLCSQTDCVRLRAYAFAEQTRANDTRGVCCGLSNRDGVVVVVGFSRVGPGEYELLSLCVTRRLGASIVLALQRRLESRRLIMNMLIISRQSEFDLTRLSSHTQYSRLQRRNRAVCDSIRCEGDARAIRNGIAGAGLSCLQVWSRDKFERCAVCTSHSHSS